eukprot:10734015-Alexandrium_andersonii.AAC.1
MLARGSSSSARGFQHPAIWSARGGGAHEHRGTGRRICATPARPAAWLWGSILRLFLGPCNSSLERPTH